MDESALTTVQKTQKVFAQKGKKQVGAITSAERGQHVTVVACVGSTGNFIPPALIFPRKNHKAELFDGAPPGTLQLCNDSGYMVGELFLRWMQHFISYVKPSIQKKIILLLDGHASHKNFEAVQLAKANGIIILCLPPHCTHRLQPLDVSFFGPLDAYYNSEVTLWLKNNPGRTVGLYQLSRLFASAYGKAATVGNALSGFRATGIVPLNPDIFPEYLFAPSQTTDRQQSDNTESQLEDNATIPGVSGIDAQQENRTEQSAEVFNETSALMEESSSLSEKTKSILNKISPAPIRKSNLCPRKMTSKGSIVLTLSPCMAELKEKQQKKVEIEEKRLKRRAAKRKLNYEEDKYDSDEICQTDGEEDASCIYCLDLYSRSKPGEHWVRCQKCKKWSHNECAGISKRAKQFICELCQN